MVLIILLLLSPLAMFILPPKKKHTFCSIKTNFHIILSGNVQVCSHQRNKQKQQNRHIQSYPSYWPPAQVHTSHHVEAHLGLTAVHDGRRSSSRAHVNKCSLEKDRQEEPMMLHITTAYSNFGKTRRLKIHLIGHEGCPLSFTWMRQPSLIKQFTGRK